METTVREKTKFWDDNPVDITSEANFIWGIANKLRGSYMPDKYGDVVIPMTIIRRLRKHPEKLMEMVPDFKALYKDIVTEDYSRSQLDKVIAVLKSNAEKGICTLFHCTAGKDRTGVVSMALLKTYGVADKVIINDYMRTNRYAFLKKKKKCVGIGVMTWNWSLVKIAYQSFMARRELIEVAIKHYKQ